MNLIEIIAVLFTFISVYLTIKGNILCWSTGLVGITFYSILFYQNNLLADLGLQFVFFIQSIIGWINWKKPKLDLKPTWLSYAQRGIVINLTILTYMIIFIITNRLGGNLPILDSAVATFSIIAMTLLIFKKIESWFFWILNDIILISIFISTDLYLSAFIYFTFLIMATKGFLEWRKNIKIV
jgi:nicotinamide mononucleotide transporter